MAKATERWASTWSGPFWASSSRTKMAGLAGRERSVAADADPGALARVPDVALLRSGHVAVAVAHHPAPLAQVPAAAAAVVHRPDLVHEVGGIGPHREGVPAVAHLG